MNLRVTRRTLALWVLMTAWPALTLAAKTDVIVLKNADHITGEVKGLSRGKLDYSTDDMGRPAVEWVKVERVTSANSFEVEVGSGAKYFGKLVAGERAGILVVAGSTSDTLAIPSVVRISRLDAGFLQRVRAYLDLGFTYAKANQATTFNTSGEGAYRGEKVGSKLSFDSYAQGQETVPTTTRNSAAVQGTYYLPRRWSTMAVLTTEQNDELNLELRLTGAGLLGRALIQSNSMELGLAGGLALARERFSPTAVDAAGENSTSFEAVLAGQWDAFRFDAPTLDFGTSLSLYPSLSTGGRIRGESTTRLKYELFPDFDVGVTITDTFDSKPPEEDATKNDFVTTFTIGWSYRR